MVVKLKKYYLYILAFACGFLWAGGFILAEGPSWWTERGVLTADSPDDNAPVVLGQLKKIAFEAYREMEKKLPVGNAKIELEIQGGPWLSDNVDNAVANIGQVKQIASLIYDWLIEVGYTDSYPWADGATRDPGDYAAATIGQVKYVFNIDIDVDADGDGLYDWWEITYFGNIDDQSSADDPDGDGLTNSEEFWGMASPLSTDTDGDGISDAVEILEFGSKAYDASDSLILLEEARRKVIAYSNLVDIDPPEFINAAGTPADLQDIKNAFNALEGKFYQIKEQ